MTPRKRLYGEKPKRVVRLAGGSQTPGTPGGGWQLSPDQKDRNTEHSEDEIRGWQSGSEEQRAQRRAKKRRLPYYGSTQTRKA